MTGQIVPRGTRRFGADGASYFFGYYNKSPWDRTGRWLLAHRSPLHGGALTGEEVAEIGMFDTAGDGAFQPLTRTKAWNWQMGAQLQWLGGTGRHIIFNVRADSVRDPVFGAPFHARVLDIGCGEARDLPLPVYVVATDGSAGYCVNYARLAHTHPTIGYFDGAPVAVPSDCPDGDGIFRMDIATGQFAPVVSFAELARLDPRESMRGAVHWASHLEVSPDGKRLLFLHRWTRRVEDETCFLHRLLTCNPDGSGLRLLECSDHPLPQLDDTFDPAAVGLFDYEKSEYQISHPLWIDSEQLIVWGPHDGVIGYHIYDDRSNEVTRIGDGLLNENGHMSYDPAGRLLLSDTYPDAETGLRDLFLWDERNGKRLLARLRTDPALVKTDRCDLHPRWNHEGTQVCVDSVHDGWRGVYVLNTR